jgi:hypothetical protein
MIDTTFHMESDARGKDPDSHSPTLRLYHQLLWSKTLPDGAPFDLDAKLHHRSDLGEFWLSSDAITHTYRNWERPAQLAEVVSRVPRNEVQRFYDLGSTIGGYLVFPYALEKINDRWLRTINQARGTHPRIRDRFDLTLECIRRHYTGQTSPLSETLNLYARYFDLFGDFRGFVDYFLLGDLVSDDYESVGFYTEFDDFQRTALPMASVEEYRTYMERSMEFVRARNARIASVASGMQG